MNRQHPSTPGTCTGHKRRQGQTMIGLLVVVVIMIGMYMMFLGSRRGDDGEVRPSIAKESIERAKTVGVGGNNKRQIGMCLDNYKNDNNGQVPPDLPTLKAYCKEIPGPMWVNPVDGRPFLYDAQTGTVYGQDEAPPAGTASSADAPVAGAPAAPAPAAPAQPGERAPGGIRLPDMQPQAPMDAE